MLPWRYRKIFESGINFLLKGVCIWSWNNTVKTRLSNLKVRPFLYCISLPYWFSEFTCGHYDLHSPPEPEDEDNFDEEDNSNSQGPEAVEFPLAAVKHQVDVLLEEWNKGADMLFSIHPMDGSLLVWHVDWLDEYQPGMFRQAQVRSLLMWFLIMWNNGSTQRRPAHC